MSRSIIICLILSFFIVSCQQKVDKSEKAPTVESKSSPVEDSAKNIINRTDDKIKDSSKKQNPSKTH